MSSHSKLPSRSLHVPGSSSYRMVGSPTQADSSNSSYRVHAQTLILTPSQRIVHLVAFAAADIDG